MTHNNIKKLRNGTCFFDVTNFVWCFFSVFFVRNFWIVIIFTSSIFSVSNASVWLHIAIVYYYDFTSSSPILTDDLAMQQLKHTPNNRQLMMIKKKRNIGLYWRVHSNITLNTIPIRFICSSIIICACFESNSF